MNRPVGGNRTRDHENSRCRCRTANRPRGQDDRSSRDQAAEQRRLSVKRRRWPAPHTLRVCRRAVLQSTGVREPALKEGTAEEAIPRTSLM